MNLSGEKLLKIHIDNEVLLLKSEFRSIQFGSVRYGSIVNYGFMKSECMI